MTPERRAEIVLAALQKLVQSRMGQGEDSAEFFTEMQEQLQECGATPEEARELVRELVTAALEQHDRETRKALEQWGEQSSVS